MPDFERVNAIFHAAKARGAGGRAALLDEQCGGDAELRREVESLLEADERAGEEFLEKPLVVVHDLLPPGQPPLPEGARLGPYVVVRQLGEGVMAVVYLAADTRLDRKVALKVLRPEFARDPRFRERMRREARAVAALSHPGIATLYGLDEIDDGLALVYEYVRGATLRAEIEGQPLPLEIVIDTGVQVAQALAAAHAAGVVHCDLKPENVMRGHDGRLRILDFGIARFTGRRVTGAGGAMASGTPGYMAPEQVEGAEVDDRTDIYALGVLLLELATGRRPFDPSSLVEAKPAVPEGLDRIIRRCLARKPVDRYRSALDVAQDLGELRRAGLSAQQSRLETASAWWVAHQASAIAVGGLMIWPVALVYGTAKSDWTLALLLAAIAAAGVTGTLRVHLLFTWRYNPGEVPGQLRYSEPWLHWWDRLFAALLLAAAIPTARSHVVRSAILAAVAFGWAVVSTVVEPATRRAAWPDADA